MCQQSDEILGFILKMPPEKSFIEAGGRSA
jgi:hypothetical protein